MLQLWTKINISGLVHYHGIIVSIQRQYIVTKNSVSIARSMRGTIQYGTTTSHGVFICDACSQQSLARLSKILKNHFYLIRKTKINFKTRIKGLIY